MTQRFIFALGAWEDQQICDHQAMSLAECTEELKKLPLPSDEGKENAFFQSLRSSELLIAGSSELLDESIIF